MSFRNKRRFLLIFYNADRLCVCSGDRQVSRDGDQVEPGVNPILEKPLR